MSEQLESSAANPIQNGGDAVDRDDISRTELPETDLAEASAPEFGNAAMLDRPKTKISALTDLPAIAAYLSRIGAEPRSLRVAVVKEAQGAYWSDVAIIRIQKYGSVEAPDGYAPTEAEAAIITQQVLGAEWPTNIKLGKSYGLPEELKGLKADDIFELRDRAGRLIMIHARTKSPKTGEKRYVPWTYWSDHEWRKAEPEGNLPLYGLETIGDNTTVFIHEGAKAARSVARLIEPRTEAEKAALQAHPWGTELGGAAHLGWIGGALSPARTDWSELAKAGVTRAYIVADNDKPGKAAIKKVSLALRPYEITLLALRFDDQFPVSFDLADNFPDRLFKNNHLGAPVYVGPSFNDLIRPATWATAPNPMPPGKGGKGRPPKQSYHMRKIFMDDWWMVVGKKDPIFINQHNRTRFYSEKAFSVETRALADCNILDLFKAAADTRKMDEIAYEPGREIEINVDGERCINTWTEASMVRGGKAGDIRPEGWAFWEKLLEHLFPIQEERHEVMKWCATLIVRPKVRMLYALVLWSQVQGVGKTTLCEILAKLVGEQNSRNPFAHDVVASPFNGWIVRKRFVYVNEIYEAGKWESYDRLKTYITDGTIEANEKMVPGYQVRNWAHFILCSNSSTPLVVDEHDRRLLVPEVTDQKQPLEWWQSFHLSLGAGGYKAI